LGEASAEEQKAVKSWIEEDEANRKYFDQFKLIWDTSRQLAVHSTADENKAWQRFQNKIRNAEQLVPPGREDKIPAKKKNLLWVRIAASVILITGIALITYLVTGRAKEKTILAEQTPVTESLPDGSAITLNKRSFIYYQEKARDDKRTVRLKGEAFFNVVPDKKKPFIIHANNLEVTVVGTSFNVKAGFDGVTEVVVETGIVRVTNKNRSVELKAGERVTISNKDTAFAKQGVTDKLYNYYRSRQFVCDNTPLWKLVDVLNEAYDVNIVFGNEKTKDYRLNTTFNNESLDQILKVLSDTFSLIITRSGDQIILN
jgi:transmembrane sensor